MGGGLAILQTGDLIRVDLNASTINMLVPEEELSARRAAFEAPVLDHQTPWQEIYRGTVGQLAEGGCMELATRYRRVAHRARAPATALVWFAVARRVLRRNTEGVQTRVVRRRSRQTQT